MTVELRTNCPTETTSMADVPIPLKPLRNREQAQFAKQTNKLHQLLLLLLLLLLCCSAAFVGLRLCLRHRLRLRVRGSPPMSRHGVQALGSDRAQGTRGRGEEGGGRQHLFALLMNAGSSEHS